MTFNYRKSTLLAVQNERLVDATEKVKKLNLDIDSVEHDVDKYVSDLNETNEKVCQLISSWNEKQESIVTHQASLENEIDEFNFNTRLSSISEIVPFFKIIRNITNTLDMSFTNLNKDNTKNGLNGVHDNLIKVNEILEKYNTRLISMSNGITQDYHRFLISTLAFNYKAPSGSNVDISEIKKEYPFFVEDNGLNTFYYMHFIKTQKTNIKEAKAKFTEELTKKSAQQDYINFVKSLEISQAVSFTNKCFKFPLYENLQRELFTLFKSLEGLKNTFECINDTLDKHKTFHVEEIADQFFLKYNIQNKTHFEYYFLGEPGRGVSCLDIAKASPDKFFFGLNNMGGRRSRYKRNKSKAIDPYEIEDETMVSSSSSDEDNFDDEPKKKKKKHLYSAENEDDSDKPIETFFSDIDNFFVNKEMFQKNNKEDIKENITDFELKNKQLDTHYKKLDIMFKPFLRIMNVDGSRMLFNSLSYYFMTDNLDLSTNNLDDFLNRIKSFGEFWVLIDTFFGSSTDYLDKYLEENFEFEDNIKKTLFLLNKIINDTQTHDFSLKKLVADSEKLLFPWKSSFRDYAIIIYTLFKKTQNPKLLSEADSSILEFSHIVFSYPLNSVVLQPHFLMLVLWVFGRIEKNCGLEKNEINENCLNLFERLRREQDEITMTITSFILIKIMDVIFYSFNESNFFEVLGETQVTHTNISNAVSSSGKYGTIKSVAEFEYLIPTMLSYIKGFEQSMNINNILIYDIVNSDIVNEYMIQADIVLNLCSKLVTDVASISNFKTNNATCFLNISTFKIIIKSLFEYFKQDFLNSIMKTSSDDVKTNDNMFYAPGQGPSKEIFNIVKNSVSAKSLVGRGGSIIKSTDKNPPPALSYLTGRENLLNEKYKNLIDLYIKVINKGKSCFVYKINNLSELKNNHDIEPINVYSPLLNNKIITNNYPNTKKNRNPISNERWTNVSYLLSSFKINLPYLEEVSLESFTHVSDNINPEQVYKFKNCIPLKLNPEIEYKIVELEKDSGFAILNSKLDNNYIDDFYQINKELNCDDWCVMVLPKENYDPNLLTSLDDFFKSSSYSSSLASSFKHHNNHNFDINQKNINPHDNTQGRLKNKKQTNKFECDCDMNVFIVTPCEYVDDVRNTELFNIKDKELMLTLSDWKNAYFINNARYKNPSNIQNKIFDNYNNDDNNNYNNQILGLGGSLNNKIKTKICDSAIRQDNTDYNGYIKQHKKVIGLDKQRRASADISFFDFKTFLKSNNNNTPNFSDNTINIEDESIIHNTDLLYLNIEMQHKKFSSLLEIILANTNSLYNQVIKSIDKYIEYTEFLCLSNISMQYFLKNIDNFFFNKDIPFTLNITNVDLKNEINQIFKDKNVCGYFTFSFKRLNELICDETSQLSTLLRKNSVLYNFFLYISTINSHVENEITFKSLNISRGLSYYVYINFVFFYQILAGVFDLNTNAIKP